MPACDLLLFDLDGTLVDTSIDLTASANQVRAARGLDPVSRAKVLSWVGDGAAALVQRALAPDPGDPDEMLDLFRRHHQLHLLDHATPYPGVVETLEALRSRTLVVLTNKPETLSRRLLEGLGLARHFRGIHGPESFREKKPSPAPVCGCVELYGSLQARTMMIGDGPQDITAGRLAGVHTAAVTYGFRSREEILEARPEIILDRLPDLLDHVS